jgi:(E)-4-hydroxy-3-methylbut-2-enyl-diphosphate synthase
MKASNPVVMIQAYRLLAAEMRRIGWNYPLHLGVTEAGEGEDGRIKSSIGIGTLLLDGLGDTIRVSLTEDPWAEIDPCNRLVRFAQQRLHQGIVPFEEKNRDFENLQPRKIFYSDSSPLHRDGTVLLKVDPSTDFLSDLGCKIQLNQIEKGIDTPDILWLDSIPAQLEPTILRLQKAGIGILTSKAFPGTIQLSSVPLNTPYALLSDGGEIPSGSKPEFILFKPAHSPLHETRLFIDRLKTQGIEIPVILALSYSCTLADLPIHAGAEAGACLSDKLVQGICIESVHPTRTLSFNLLQGARMRTTKTDFISCPGCGRTLFDLQEVSRRIREKTAHLPGVKIAIMGCIVNGPGEMADADFGYVGSRSEKIDLYVGKTCVEKNIDFAEADERLIDLIKAHGKWKEPEEVFQTLSRI